MLPEHPESAADTSKNDVLDVCYVASGIWDGVFELYIIQFFVNLGELVVFQLVDGSTGSPGLFLDLDSWEMVLSLLLLDIFRVTLHGVLEGLDGPPVGDDKRVRIWAELH